MQVHPRTRSVGAVYVTETMCQVHARQPITVSSVLRILGRMSYINITTLPQHRSSEHAYTVNTSHADMQVVTVVVYVDAGSAGKGEE